MENFIFTWGHDKCKHIMYHSPNISEVLHRYKKPLKDVFVQYGDRLDILFIYEVQYNL